jgi:hypothetical protein
VQLPRTREFIPGFYIPELKIAVATSADNIFSVMRYCNRHGALVIPTAFLFLCFELPNYDGIVIGNANHTFVA